MRGKSLAAGFVILSILAVPAEAQITVLDSAQDQPQGGGQTSQPAAPVGPAVTPVAPAEPGAIAAPPPCGSQDMTIARMSWASAALLAEIHARILTAEYGCAARVVTGDLAATTSSMASTGQPAVAPEMWVTRVADVWNAAIESQMVRSAAPTFAETTMEGWFVPAYLENAFGDTLAASAIAPTLSNETHESPVRFISCPADWACAVINRNLIAAHGLSDLVQVVEPANRFELDALIAEAVSRRDTFLFYYWQPNAVLAQVDFRPLDMGEHNEEAMQCLAKLACASPAPSAFPSEMVVASLADWVFAEAPAVAGYFQRASLPLAEMNALLAQLNEAEASVESVAQRFVEQRRDIWGAWVGATP